MKPWAALILLYAVVPASFAHEVRHQVAAEQAVVLRLRYADGQPFAFEAYEVFAQGAEKPQQVGRTDAEGRAVFLPPASAELRFRAFAADGHGVDLKLNPPRAAESVPAAEEEDRSSKLVLGVGILLALFGLVQLVLRRKKHP
ncbi:MAG: ABC transporter permease [Betaproteobacteria bacterium]|nr:ABC transporter permease [Betaproteobacteria bacterium]